jgi:hypothetical protein
VYETQSAIFGADIPHGFAKGGLHPTLQELFLLNLTKALRPVPWDVIFNSEFKHE